MSVLRDGDSLPFKERPQFSRFSLIVSKSCQEQGPFRSSCLPPPKESCGKSGCQVIPGLLQPSFSSSQAQQKKAANFGFKHSQSLFRDQTFKMETPETIRLSLQQGEWVTSLDFKDAWLLRAQCRETCLQHTWILLDLCQKLCWVVNLNKCELTHQKVFNFVGYRYDLNASRVLPTQDQ